MNKKFFETTQFVVYTYAICYMLLTVWYCLPRILAEFTTLNVSHISEGFTFNLELFAWGLMAMCASYCCVDRAAFTVKTSLMDIGTCDVGDITKLRKVIRLLILIFIENMMFNFFLGHPFTVYTESGKQEFKGIDLPLDGIISALVSSCVLCVAGDGAIGIAKNVTSKKKEDEVEK